MIRENDPLTSESVRREKKNLLASAWKWFDERTGFGLPLARFFHYPVPLFVHKNILYSLGGLIFIAISLQAVTGILLTFFYDPSPQEAYNSVDYITYQSPLGWLVRSLHVYNASVIVVLIALHLARTFFFSAYKKPREITWLSGVFMLLLVMGMAFTGVLLPWDQKGYWATKVGSEIAASMPVIGAWMGQLFRGGAILGQATLSRFFVLHTMLLPGALALLIVLHIHQLRKHGIAPPITERAKAQAKKFVRFFPHWVVIDASLGLLLLLLLMGFSMYQRAPLEFPADPGSVNYVPRPEWYFLFLFQSLKYFPGVLEPIAAIVVPGILVGGLILLPFLDRGEERRPWRKPVTTIIFSLGALALIALTVLALITE